MKVAIVHYHLGPGGVSQVIAATSRALTAANVRHVILIGDEKNGSGQAAPPIRTIPGLGYLPGADGLTANALTTRLRAAAHDALGQAPDIWHFHNHSLGKNILLAEVVAGLAEEGEAIILQIHDLAEDGRPAKHQIISGQPKIYPFSPRVQYAFLNSRDLRIFSAAGLPPENASILANPISSSSKITNHQSSIIDPRAPLLFAPVRGIRRKNLGELVFLSTLAPLSTRFAISRAPRDAGALAIHDRWNDFARTRQLPIGFDVVDRFTPVPGASAGFESWLTHATHIITTSVAEGFGLPFLEAIAHEKPLVGRNLAHLAADHASHGILAGDLYEQLLVPAEWIDLTILRDHLQTTLERNYRCYGLRLFNITIDAAFEALIHNGWLDFGNLPEPLQQGVIERMADPASRGIPMIRKNAHTCPASDWLADTIVNRTPTATPDQLAPYSPETYQTHLLDLYSRCLSLPPSPLNFVSPEKILTSYLTPDSFHFLLSIPKPESSAFSYRAVVFDIYGTLLIAPAGGVKPDPSADPLLREILRNHGYEPLQSPSTELHEAVLRHHAAAGVPFPEVDLRLLWREILGLEPGIDTTQLVIDIEAVWHPVRPMPSANPFIRKLAMSGISLGLLSNGQCNTLASLGGIADLFPPELTLLSYQHGIAKPSLELFQMLADRLAGRGITPGETLFIGNDPLQDIIPAASHGFKTAWFTGHPDSLRPGHCEPDITFSSYHQISSQICILPSTRKFTN